MRYVSISGTITAINDMWTSDEQRTGCSKLMTVEDSSGNIVNFSVTPATYFVDHAMVNTGDAITGFYDADVPVILIYPPQYQAVVMAKVSIHQNVAVDYFDSNLVSSNGMLKLNLSPLTKVELENSQAFYGSLGNRHLIVIYGAATRSIPAQTTPYKIIVMCPRD